MFEYLLLHMKNTVQIINLIANQIKITEATPLWFLMCTTYAGLH